MPYEIFVGDCIGLMRTALADESVQCCVTSPPYYGLRDYQVAGQMGLEASPQAYVERMVEVFREVRRVLRKDGTVFLNLGDSYFGGGRVGNPIESPHQKQRTNRGSVSMPASVRHGRKTDRDVSGLAHRDYTTAPLKPKDLIGIPWRVALALQADGWYLRQDIIWAKPNPMPESVRDRCTKAHEYIFLLSKSPRYYFDADAIAEPAVRGATGSKFNTGKTAEPQLGLASDKPRKQDQVGKRTYTGFNARYKESGPVEMRNKRDVWTVPTRGFKGAHFATFPPALIEPCILAGCPEGGTVLDPFGGAGTTALVAMKHKRNAILLELNPAYAEIARRRLE